MEQRSSNKIKLFRTLKVVFYCLGLPLFVLATLVTAISLFAGEYAYAGLASSELFANMQVLFKGTSLYGFWVAFGIWAVIALIHIILAKTVKNRRARTVIVAAITLIVMLVPVVVMDLVMPVQLDAIAENAADGVVVESYKDQLGHFNSKTSDSSRPSGRRIGYNDLFIQEVENVLVYYNIGLSGAQKAGVADNTANKPITYEEIYGYTGSETGLVKVAPNADGKLELDGVVYEGYYFAKYSNSIPAGDSGSATVDVTRYVWYKTSKMSQMRDGIYGYASYNSNGMLSDGYVFGIDVALRILEDYYYAQMKIDELGGSDKIHEKIIEQATQRRYDEYNSDPELAFIWNQAFGDPEDVNDGEEAEHTITQGDLANILGALGAAIGKNSYIVKLLSFVNGVYPLKFDVIGGGETGQPLELGIEIKADEEKGLQIILSGSLVANDTGFAGAPGWDEETKTFTVMLDGNLIGSLSRVLDMIAKKFLNNDVAGLLNSILGNDIVGTLLGLLGINLPITVAPGMTTEDVLNGLISDLLGGLYWYDNPEIKPVYDYYEAAAVTEEEKELAKYYAMLDRANYEGGLHGYMIGSVLIPGSSLIAGDTIGNGTYPSSVGLADYASVKQLQTDLAYKRVCYPLFSLRELIVGFLPFVMLFTILSGIAGEREMLFATGQEVVVEKSKKSKKKSGKDEDVAAPSADEQDIAVAENATEPDAIAEETTEPLVSEDNEKEVL